MNANHERELDWLATKMREVGCRSYLEIGARNGISVERLVNAGAIADGGRIVAVDLPGGPWGEKKSEKSLLGLFDRLRARGFDATVILQDSALPGTRAMVEALAPFDALYIDADHRYEAVRRDWETYGPMIRRLVALDDVGGQGQKVNKADPTAPRMELGVHRLWTELKERFPDAHDELVLPLGKGMACLQGIGIIRL